MSNTNATGCNYEDLFYKNFITSKEICQRLDITTAALSIAIKRGKMKKPLNIPHLNSYIWAKSEVTEYLDSWNNLLIKKRSGKNQ